MTVRIVRPSTAFALSGTRKKRPRVEDDAHLRFIRLLPCCVTGVRTGIEAAHVRYGDITYGKRETGASEKSDDRWTVPLSQEQHRDQHAHNEREWWISKGIDPLKLAMLLHANSGDDEACECIIREARRA